ncbi:MAG: GUN4 N-terminal ARM-like repeat domain-containing protein [Calothrix sp. FI2-JRJ7]|jgi:phage gp46-like protein|nr:GUN4 N-terminal ARM-like repeat domain-containing protein [Calothrix sp. FI2-JRJ7]
MGNNSKEPREFDAVKGGQAPPPVDGVVLGGIEGLRQRFVTGNEQVRLDVVINALIYGDEGLDILVKALKDASLQVRIKAYQILKQSNQAESETAKGLRLNVGDKIYCVYRSSLSYGDDWYYLVDSINDYDDEDYYDEDEKYEPYEPLSNDEDGYLHYITDIKDNINTQNPYYWADDYNKPSLNSFHIDLNRAEETAKYLHRQRLL